ncbi:hypothetical protein LINPERHAP1_LOCUS30536 [Linum perenne]
MFSLGISKEEFHAITWFTSWAVDGDHGAEVSDSGLHLELAEREQQLGTEVESVVKNIKPVEIGGELTKAGTEDEKQRLYKPFSFMNIVCFY